MAKSLRSKQGISLQELLIVIAVLGILAFLGAAGYLTQLKKARDGKRRSDIQRMKVSFEDYFNDYGCYPVNASVFNDSAFCGSDGFQPWLTTIPCDPLGEPYRVSVEETICPGWYAIYTQMEYVYDPQLEANECFSGCVVAGETYNYGSASDNITADQVAGSPEGPTATPTPTSLPAPTATLTPTPTIGSSPTPTATPGPPCSSSCYRLYIPDIGSPSCNGPLGQGETCNGGNCYTDNQCSPSCRIDSCTGGS